MLFTSFLVTTLCLSQFFTGAATQDVYNQPCPLLGINYPNPSSYASSNSIQTAMTIINNTVSGTLNGTSKYGPFNISTTAFSVDIYSLHDESSLLTYHFTPEKLIALRSVGVRMVDSNTVYRIGSVSKLYTVYMYLISAGDETWNQPIAKFVPEIATYIRNSKTTASNNIDDQDWNSITVGALAAQLAGLPRDSGYSPLLQRALQSLGVPPSSSNQYSQCGDDARARVPCNRTAFFQEYLHRHPIVPPFTTPTYSNPTYQILSYALENITGIPMTEIFQKTLVRPLGLTNTHYTVPTSPNNSIIPFNETVSWWNADALDQTPAGGYFSSINDMRRIGQSILNSTYLTPAQTRRWMKPHSLTSNVNYTVGAPWEIRRAPSDQVSWIYSKSGDLGAYSAMTALLPEHNVGFSVLGAGTNTNAVVRILSNIVSAELVPALQTAARTHAASVYAGTYADASTNSSITLAVTGPNSGLEITDWKFGSRDVLPLLGMLYDVDRTKRNMTARLTYSGLEQTGNNGTVMSWRALYQVFPQPLDVGAFSTNCASWLTVNSLSYGGVGLDEFLFTLDARGSSAVSVEPRVLGDALAVGKLPRAMRRVG